MTISISVKADVKDAIKYLDNVQRKAVPKAAARALNRTATTARAQASKDLREEMGQTIGLSSAGFKKAIAIKRAKQKHLVAVLTASGKPLPLVAFGARKTKSGVSAAAWGKRKIYRGTFIAKMPSGHRGVFTRTSKRRLPISELWGPSIPKAFLERRVQVKLRQVISREWPKRFKRELDYYLSRLK